MAPSQISPDFQIYCLPAPPRLKRQTTPSDETDEGVYISSFFLVVEAFSRLQLRENWTLAPRVTVTGLGSGSQSFIGSREDESWQYWCVAHDDVVSSSIIKGIKSDVLLKRAFFGRCAVGRFFGQNSRTHGTCLVANPEVCGRSFPQTHVLWTPLTQHK